jgi:putative sporulation protein YtxC
MRFLSIGINGCTHNIIDSLVNQINNLNQKKFKIQVTIVKYPEVEFIVCRCTENNIIASLSDAYFMEFKNSVAEILCDSIIKNYEENLLLKIINSNYFFNPHEKKKVMEISKVIINGEQNYKNHSYQKKLIYRRLWEYLKANNEIILDGFVNFRAKEYVKYLEDIAEKAVDNFLIEREYQEFIKLLKYFVDMQEPKLEAVHILSGFDDRYIILDHKQNEITNDCIKEFLSEVPEGEMNFDDFLVSSLITIAPIRIYIHIEDNLKNKELLQTIKNVFDGKVIICNGCSICKGNNVSKMLTKNYGEGRS